MLSNPIFTQLKSTLEEFVRERGFETITKMPVSERALLLRQIVATAEELDALTTEFLNWKMSQVD